MATNYSSGMNNGRKRVVLLWSDVQGPSATSVVLRSFLISEDMRIVLGLNSIYHLPLEHEAIISFTHLEFNTELQA